MKKLVSGKPRKRGRPATGRDPFIGIRLPHELIVAIDGWKAAHQAQSRSDAIRQLVESGLSNAAPPGRRDQASTAKAFAMARKALESATKEDAAPPEEQERRKRRLLKGPKEFRDIRGDARQQHGKVK